MVLAWIIDYSRRIDYCSRATSNDKRMIYMPELCCPCTMHMENRVSEKLVGVTATQPLLHDRSETYKIKIEGMNKVVNSALSNIRTEEFRGGASVYELIVDNDSKKINCKLSCVRFKKLRDRRYIDEFISISMRGLEDVNALTSEDISLAFSLFEECVKLVNARKMDCYTWYKCQHYMDKFGEQIVQRFGTADVTQYIHAMRAGHFTQFINRKEGQYQNIFDHNQIGLEHCIKKTRTHNLKRTQHNGFHLFFFFVILIYTIFFSPKVTNKRVNSITRQG